jgi:hypothetical protein
MYDSSTTIDFNLPHQLPIIKTSFSQIKKGQQKLFLISSKRELFGIPKNILRFVAQKQKAIQLKLHLLMVRWML